MANNLDRTKLSILNVGSNVFILMCRTVLTFIVRTVFIKMLGQEYLGVSGLFDQLFTILSIADLGLGTAISYSLYKPLAEDNHEEVSRLMYFYKIMYSYVGIIITVIGIAILPFLGVIMKGNVVGNIEFIYALYLFNTVSMYFISYKDTLILADQRNYKLTKINFLAYLIMNVAQLIVLFLTKNFIIYLLIQSVVTVVQRILINRYITKEYKHIDFNCKKKLEPAVLKEIKTNVKAIFFHKIGNCMVTSTDNIIISSVFGVIQTGIYTNYLSLTSMVNSLLYSIFNGVTSSFGNLAAIDKEGKLENIFKLLNFLGFIVFGFISISFFIILNDFIVVWVGDTYLLPLVSVVIICVNFYITGIRYPLDTVKEASGIYNQDKYISICHAVSNLLISLLLSYWIGFNGVLLGTTISTLLFPGWNRPYTVYKYVFNKKATEYFIDYFKKTIFLIGTSVFIYFVINKINLEISFINLILKMIIVAVVYCILIVIFYRNDESFKYYIGLIKNRIFHP